MGHAPQCILRCFSKQAGRACPYYRYLCANLKTGEAVLDTATDIAKSQIEGPILGHVGDGNFHAILLVDPDSSSDEEASRLSDRMVERALAVGGTSTGDTGWA